MGQGSVFEAYGSSRPESLQHGWAPLPPFERLGSWAPVGSATTLPDSQLLYGELYGALLLLRGFDAMGSVERRVAAWRFARQLEQLTPLNLPEGELDWATHRLREGLWEAQESQQRATSRVEGSRRAATALMTALVSATSRELSRLEQKLGLARRLGWRARLRDVNCELGRRCQALWRAHRSHASGQLEQLFGSERPSLHQRLRLLLRR